MIYALSGLSCQHCVANVRQALVTLDSDCKVNRTFAQVSDDVAAHDVINAISAAGYNATLAQHSAYDLSLSGLNCGHCIASVEKALQAYDANLIYTINKTALAVFAPNAPDEVIAVIEQAGFHANKSDSVQCPKTDGLSETADSPVMEAAPEQTSYPIQLALTGLSCAACVAKVEKALSAVEGVSAVQVNLADSTALVAGNVDDNALINAITHAGYRAEVVRDVKIQREKSQQHYSIEINQLKRRAIVALFLGGALMLWGWVFGMNMADSTQMGWLIVGLLCFAVMMYSGKHFFSNAISNLRHATTTMDTLVALGTGTAWLFSMSVVLAPAFYPEQARHLYFEASLMIIGLINLGKMLEMKAKHHSSQALNKLLDLTPQKVRLLTAQGEKIVSLDSVKKGMQLRLKTGDKVPVDGVVESGQAWLNEAMLTGEPLQVRKVQGDMVRAGTIVDNGILQIKVTGVGENTMLANIIRLVKQAQSSKPKIAQLADNVAAIFVPAVCALAVLAFILWLVLPQSPNFAQALVVFTSVLIIACPCALGLATPMSIIAAVARAAQLGILVRDAQALQNAACIDTVVFDKTGTLTQGKPTLTHIHAISGDPTALLMFATALEKEANHPLASAFVNDQRLAQHQLPPVHNFHTHNGMGISGEIDGETFFLGNLSLMQAKAVVMPENVHNEACIAREHGGTVIFLARQRVLLSFFVVQDPVREDSAYAIKQLHAMGIKSVMLTGDNQATANAIAHKLGINEVIADVLPSDKADVIARLQQRGSNVAMVGDGINDAPALARANVSIAIANGSDIAIETAGLTLMNSNISAVRDVLMLSQATMRNIKQNLFGAFIYNSLGIPIAMGILYPIWGVMLNPVFAAAAMALSSVTVVTNANRLLRFKP
ncbi:cation transporter [Spirabiliibacterium falconis]|uniref:cation transporter n=1 Tax=Spirabiliibacterium falconis TaxID=572023 RepID=UPI001AAD5676|nr:copper-translocating P-type ATPase [Spirabiliibacterium falconis]MBE2894046.1 copper-translocating P-type ATPase [Spirabiliibacterium falconis]